MKYSLRRIAIIVLAIYIGISCYTAYMMFVKKAKPPDEEIEREEIKKDNNDDWNPWGLELSKRRDEKDGDGEEGEAIDWQKDFGMKDVPEHTDGEHIVEIWGKAAIGTYLWEHIMGAEMEPRLGGVWSYGTKKIGNILFRYRTGPGVVPTKVPQGVENLVLVLNGREDSKIEFARMWLDYLPNFSQLRRVAVVLLGNERCENEWIKDYMVAQGGMVNILFLVYDSEDVDEEFIYQWPLGVATYRQFPRMNRSSVAVNEFRPFQCNFLGTVYRNSSRETLLRVIRDHTLTHTCYIKPRLQWSPSETASSLDEYIRAMGSSDLTLHPAGLNTECYRLYEAMSLGSVPLIEDTRTPGACSPTPLRLLKEYKAPVLWIKQWAELPEILRKEKLLTLQDLVRRRKEILDWYDDFKLKMRHKFVNVLKTHFFGGR